MLVPAILFRDDIVREIQKYYYATDMMYETGCLESWCPDIPDDSDADNFFYAIVNNENKLIGFITYKIDWYVSKAYNFGLFSFDRGNPIVGRDVFNKLEELVHKMHRVEWRAVGGNPACRGYDHFVKKHNGNKFILKDAIRDRDGNYHDDIIYEIVERGE